MECSIDGCNRAVQAKGFCNMHYHRIRRLGDPGPVGTLTNKHLPPVERFWASIKQDDETGCWVWRGIKLGRYALIRIDGRLTPAHRFAYELMVGPIPSGLDIDHLCRNTRCVNPGHLEPVTTAENLLRGEGICAQNARKTHCVHGHPLTGANVKRTKDGGRVCRECMRRIRRERYARLGR
jgi:hypothetical protein